MRCLISFVLCLAVTTSVQAEVVFSDRFSWYTLPDAGTPTGKPSARHVAMPLGSSDADQGYFRYLPPGYGDGVGFPLLLFIHGLGENGNGTSELDAVLLNGPPPAHQYRLVGRDPALRGNFAAEFARRMYPQQRYSQHD